MNGNKHTPGPWFFHEGISVDGSNGFVIRQRPGDIVAVTEPQDSEEVHEANARLITAAPDLLRMCEYMIGKLEAESNWGDDNEKYLSALKEVVQKARGE